MSDLLRFSIPVTMELFNKMKKRLDGDNSFVLDEYIEVRNNQGLFIVSISDSPVPYFISLRIECKSKGDIIYATIRKEKELYGVIRHITRKLNCYFSFYLTDIKELETASSYVLERLDNVYRKDDIINHLIDKDFNDEFELVEFCVMLLKNIALTNDALLDKIKEKYNYYGYDEDYLPNDEIAVLLKLKNSHAINWFKVSSKEFTQKILEITLLELYQKSVTSRFNKDQIHDFVSTLYGMYVYRRYYEHKKELI